MLTMEHHARILADKDNIAKQAGVPVGMLYESATKYCQGAELEWLKRFPAYRRANKGLVMIGKHSPPPEMKMMAMACALVRNYVDARVITLQMLLDAHIAIEKTGGEMPSPTVMLIPNLFVRQGGKGAPAWKMQIVYDLLLHRFTEGKLSVVYVESMDAMGAEYGNAFTQHLETHYVISPG